MARASHLGHKSKGKNASRNLQYGPNIGVCCQADDEEHMK